MSIEDLFELTKKLVGIKAIKEDGREVKLYLDAQKIINNDGFTSNIHVQKPFISTTQNQQYLDETLGNNIDKAFIILSAGDTLFELISRGVKNITALEMNKYQILVYQLRLASLKALSLNEYKTFLLDANNKNFLSREIFNYIKSAFEDETSLKVWNQLYHVNPTQDIKNRFVKTVNYRGGTLQSLEMGIPYIKNQSFYYRIREQLERTKIKIIKKEAIEYLITHPDECFDYIDITNILLFYYQMQSLNDKEIFLQKLKQLRQIYQYNLNKGGVFTFDYQFGVNVGSYHKIIQQELSKGKLINAKTQLIYQTIFEYLSQHYPLQVGRVNKII